MNVSEVNKSAGMSALPAKVVLDRIQAKAPASRERRHPAGVEASSAHKGWYSRGYLPHRDEAGLTQSITFRLADSFPSQRLNEWREWVDPKTGAILTSDAERRTRIESYLDAGHGECWLRNPRVAELVEDALLRFDGERYRLIAWAIMPNHVHVIAELLEGNALSAVVHSWKSWTAQRANEVLGRSGAFWFREYWDRFIRDGSHREATIRYVENNPVTARLVDRAEQWPWGSARRKLNKEEQNE